MFGPLQTTTQVLSIGSTLCSNPKYAATLRKFNRRRANKKQYSGKATSFATHIILSVHDVKYMQEASDLLYNELLLHAHDTCPSMGVDANSLAFIIHDSLAFIIHDINSYYHATYRRWGNFRC